jgi:hypothetical protein
MLKAMKPARLELIAMSKQAKVIQAQIESTTGDAPSINSILLNMHSESAKTNIFKRFDECKAAGYRVKPKSKSYRIWGKPRKGLNNSATESGSAIKDEHDRANSQYSFFPMCCLFSKNQVDKIEY